MATLKIRDFRVTTALNGPMLGIGVMFAPNKSSPWSAGVGYSHYFLDDDMTTESIDAAIQYDF